MFNLKATIKDHRYLITFLITYLVIRLFLLNTNYTEWGDTFRMIRAADYLSHFTWPWDEKRWPFYSILLIPGILMNAPVLYGRFLGIVISLASFSYLYAFYLKYVSRNKLYAILSVILTATTVVYAYWSIRVMADPLFSLMVLAFFYHFLNIAGDLNQKTTKYLGLSALLLCITMTRLEGFFVLASVIAYLGIQHIKIKGGFKTIVSTLLLSIKANFTKLVYFLVPQILIYAPWTIYAKIIYKGDVSNDYLDEFGLFKFDLSRLEYFFMYTAFILVAPLTLYFLYLGIRYFLKRSTAELLSYLSVLFFILCELLVGFIWTPSLPRIYLPIIPFFVMFLAFGLENFQDTKSKFIQIIKRLDYHPVLLLSFVSICIFAVMQYRNKMFFLGASKGLFVIILLTSLLALAIYALVKNKIVFISAILFLNILCSVVIIMKHKDIYKTVGLAVDQVKNIDAKIAYSDETGVSAWYLRKNGYHLPYSDHKPKLVEQTEYVREKGIDYIIWTNEFNVYSKFVDPKDDPNYELLNSFEVIVRDPLADLPILKGIIKDDDSYEYRTKVYKVLPIQ